MARKSPAERIARITLATKSWHQFARRERFFGLSVEELKAFAKPSFDQREVIADLTRRLRAAIKLRDASDAQVMKKLRGVRYAIFGHPDYGPDSDLYAAMGYTREVDRIARIGRTKRRKRLQKPAAR